MALILSSGTLINLKKLWEQMKISASENEFDAFTAIGSPQFPDPL